MMLICHPITVMLCFPFLSQTKVIRSENSIRSTKLSVQCALELDNQKDSFYRTPKDEMKVDTSWNDSF